MPNTRRCPFFGCKKLIDPALFACREHWPGMEDEYRFEIWQIYSDYLKGTIHIDDLVRRQGEIMLKTTPQIVPGATKGPGPGQGEIELAQEVERYIRLRKEYSATKDGFVDKKRNLGMQLTKLESAIAKRCKAILHPEQKQLTLFDGSGDEKNQLPD